VLLIESELIAEFSVGSPLCDTSKKEEVLHVDIKDQPHYRALYFKRDNVHISGRERAL
jgi:hypothetical protein